MFIPKTQVAVVIFLPRLLQCEKSEKHYFFLAKSIFLEKTSIEL